MDGIFIDLTRVQGVITRRVCTKVDRFEVRKVQWYVTDMIIDRGHVLFFKCDHLLLLPLVLNLLGSLPLDFKHLATLHIFHRFVMEVEKFLSLLHHILEESDCAHFEVAFHFVNLDEWEYETLSACHTLNGEKSFVQALDAIITEFKAVIDLNSVMNQGRSVDDRIFTSKE